MMVTRCTFDHICMEKARYKFLIIIIITYTYLVDLVPRKSHEK